MFIRHLELRRCPQILDHRGMDLELRSGSHFQELVTMTLTVDEEIDTGHETRGRCVQGVAGGRGESPQHVDCVLKSGVRPEDLRFGTLREIEDYKHRLVSTVY